MTGPEDPGSQDGEDWGFPEVDPAGPASVLLPDSEPEPEPVFDTGSDAWWRAQAQEQRRAAEGDLLVPSALTEPPADPLDQAWLPPELDAPEAPVAFEPEPPVAVEPQPPAEEPAGPAVAAATAPPVRDALVPPPLRTLPQYRAERVGPGRAVAGAAIAVAGVALGIGAFLLVGKDDHKGTPTVAAPPRSSAPASATPTTQPSARPTGTPTVPVVAPPPKASPTVAPVVPVTVLNNSRIKGLAVRAATRFRAGGWPVPRSGNYGGGVIATTTVYYGPGQLGSAQRFARQFGIGRVLPRFSGLPGSGVTVVLTRDYR